MARNLRRPEPASAAPGDVEEVAMRPIELRRVALFATATPADLAATAAATRSLDYRRGARLFRAGDPCDSAAVVLDGVVRLFRRLPDGAEVTTGIVRAGGLLTLCALRGAAAHDDHAEALGQVRTAELPTAVLLALVLRSPRLFEQAVRCLVARLDDAHAAAVVIAQEQVPARVLHALRCLVPPDADGGGCQAGATNRLAVRPSQDELARLVGTDRVTVTRALRLLEERGLIRRERGRVTGVALVASETRPRRPRAPGGVARA